MIPEGCAAQETDTHWRAKKGKASWNYRLLFDVELGHNSRAMKFPHLRFQLWDRDVVKWNDCAGETVLNMGRYYRKAYKKNVAVKLFEKKMGAAALRARKAAVAKPKVGFLVSLEVVCLPDLRPLLRRARAHTLTIHHPTPSLYLSISPSLRVPPLSPPL